MGAICQVLANTLQPILRRPLISHEDFRPFDWLEIKLRKFELIWTDIVLIWQKITPAKVSL